MDLFNYLLVFVLGLIFGSFFNVCIYRIPNEISIISPPSSCTNCSTRLRFFDLIPILSFVFLKGKCRYCNNKISIKYPLLEFFTGIIYLTLFHKYGMTVSFLASGFIVSILIIVFFIDLKHLIIPNGLVLTGLAGGILIIIYNIFYPVQIYSDRNWWNPLIGMVTGFGFLFLIAIIGMIVYKSDDAMGMGDVKIFAPIGIFLGWKLTIAALFISIFISALVGILLMVLKLKDRKSAIPFGPFISIGTYISLMWGENILNWYLGI